MSPQEDARAAVQAVIRSATRDKFKSKIGDLPFSISRYSREIRATVPLQSNSDVKKRLLLLLTFDVANAGIDEFASLGAITESHFDKIFSINVKGLLFTVQKALPLFQDGGGSIILTASAGGSKGIEGYSVYHATKAAIRSFAGTWIVELKHRKIRVNAISPGPIHTSLIDTLVQSEEQAQRLKASVMGTIPLGRMGNPDEVAKAALFLASDDSSYVTGIELFVDGGVAQV
jgi:NAD(P)-dependent dehydrogenase (short-subunit alcohol dehydrogenase family)